MTVPSSGATLAQYQDEFREVKASLLATCRDLVRDLNAQDRPLEALAVDEAQLYLRGAFKSLERTLTALTHGKRL